MNRRAVWPLARCVIIEAVRRKDLWVVAILGLIIMLFAGALGFFGMRGLEAFAKDLGVSVLGLFSTILAVLISARQIQEEMNRRTLCPLLARPISRFDMLLGKYCGAVLATWLAFAMLAAATAIGLLAFGVPFEPIFAQYLLLKMLGLAAVCAASFALSLFTTPSAAATFGMLLAFGSGMLSRAFVLAGQSCPSGTRWFYGLIESLVPQFSLFDIGGRAAGGWPLVPVSVVGALTVYCTMIVGAMLCLSWLRFRRRAL
ncbi:MAG: ABC transporter permease [Chloroflexi bacterium]|nr:ABC transporter permease [Chloroflexota bacterium]